MSTVTDPARDLAELCQRLSQNAHIRGDEFLAHHFSVSTWSTEFFQIIFTISERLDELVAIVQTLDMDDDLKVHAVQHISTIKGAFSQEGLQNYWSHASSKFITPENIAPIRMLSAKVRAKHSYPKLTDTERTELIIEIDQLLEWLNEHQLHEQDFLRQAMVEGLKRLRFRLERLEWLGWGYTLRSLREVIGAYMALERGSLGRDEAPDAHAVLAKLGSFVKGFFEKVKVAQDVVGSADFMLKAYGATTLLIQGKQTIAGALPLLG